MVNIISIKGLSKSYGKRRVLNKIDLEIKKGEFVAIFGPNGAGKTTLLKTISTIIEPTNGNVVVNGIDCSTNPAGIRQVIGAISHETYLYEELTARENMVFFSQMYGMKRKDIHDRVDELLKNVSLFQRADDRVGSFSRGMKQRLSIARAMLHEPGILLMDEPYTGLDQHAAENFEKVLISTGTLGITRIMITHNIERAFKVCDRMLIMDRGYISFDMLKKDIPSSVHFRETYISIVKNDTDAEGTNSL